jgi:hypothetical protein
MATEYRHLPNSAGIAASPAGRLSATRPSRRLRWCLYATGVSVWVTGMLWWFFDHYMLRQTGMGIEQDPLQVWWLRLHAALATAAIWLLGYFSAMHVQRNWPARLRRSSGLLFVVTFGLLVVSGYLLYYVDADRPAAIVANLHWLVGLCAPAAFVLHRGLSRRVR